MLYGATLSFLDAFETYWSRAVGAKTFGALNVGLEFIFLGNQKFEEYRLGLTVGRVN